MTSEEIRAFILEEGARAQRITDTIKAHLTHLLAGKGFRDVAYTCDALYSRWELTMTKDQPYAVRADVEQFLAEGLSEIGYQIQQGLLSQSFWTGT